MMQTRPDRILPEEEWLTLPPIPLHVTVDTLRVVDEALVGALDAVWETDEAALADQIQAGLKGATEMLHSALRDVSDDEQSQQAMLRSYLEASAEVEDADAEGMELGLPKLPEEVAMAAQGVRTVRAMMEELGDELLQVSREDIEEVADLALSACRVVLQLFQRATHQALTSLEGGSAEGRDEGPVVEEATEEEVAEFHRKRGLVEDGDAAPPTTTTRTIATTATAGARRRTRRRPARVLWQPLAPAVAKLAKETLPQELRAHPFKTAGLVCCVLPLSGAIVLCLPGALMTDHLLQRLYARYGPYLEVLVDDAQQVGRLGFVLTRLSVRQSYRVLRHQLRKAKADPTRALHDAGAWAWDAATHPLATAQAAYGGGKRGVESARDLAVFLWSQWAATRA